MRLLVEIKSYQGNKGINHNGKGSFKFFTYYLLF